MARKTPITLVREDGVSFQLDATTRIAISSDVSVTQHPVEDGSTVSDHAQAKPRVITLYGIVTATPWAGADTSGGARMREALDTLEASVGQLFDVVDPELGTFSNFTLSRYPAERGPLRKLPLTIELTEVRFATASYASVSAADIESDTVAATQADAVDVGAVGTTTTTSTSTASTAATTTATGGAAKAEADKSDLSQLLDWLGA